MLLWSKGLAPCLQKNDSLQSCEKKVFVNLHLMLHRLHHHLLKKWNIPKSAKKHGQTLVQDETWVELITLKAAACVLCACADMKQNGLT
jgi:hypothetical protein